MVQREASPSPKPATTTIATKRSSKVMKMVKKRERKMVEVGECVLMW